MLATIKDENKNIIAACEYNRVNDYGKWDNFGNYIYISNIEVNPGHRNNGMLKEFTRIITEELSDCEYMYFQRIKYDDRLRQYPVRKWLDLLRREK